jgi:hypothetical protein
MNACKVQLILTYWAYLAAVTLRHILLTCITANWFRAIWRDIITFNCTILWQTKIIWWNVENVLTLQVQLLQYGLELFEDFGWNFSLCSYMIPSLSTQLECCGSSINITACTWRKKWKYCMTSLCLNCTSIIWAYITALSTNWSWIWAVQMRANYSWALS